MSAPYDEDQFLQLSGIQHFSFCRRQWALIHIEQQWAENLRTIEGEILHERAHDIDASEKRGALITSRAMPIHSRRLGVSGALDVVEFSADPQGITLAGRTGLYLAYPVEYKRGKPKESDADALQLCCQAMCLEEMLLTDIPRGALYYGEIRRRQEIDFTPELRAQVEAALKEMHAMYDRRHTPKVRPR